MFSSSSSSSSKNKKQRDEIDDHHHVDGVHLGGRDYGVINDGGKKSESQTNKEKDKTTFTNDKNDAEKDKFTDNTKNKWGQRSEKEETFPKTVKSHDNVGGVHIGGHNFGTITMTGNKNEPKSSKNSQKPDKYGNIGGYHLRGDNTDDIHYDGSH
uniref:Dehydrin n=1 Tax=Panagrolaimus superbus TaxID=310955 RepID=A0A914ZBD0_9BILA